MNALHLLSKCKQNPKMWDKNDNDLIDILSYNNVEKRDINKQRLKMLEVCLTDHESVDDSQHITSNSSLQMSVEYQDDVINVSFDTFKENPKKFPTMGEKLYEFAASSDILHIEKY